mmetsp:Transcript_23692/g.31734  ORF Transcript_23692/g.31734 Transcript_23692/m.31734 type:complete len:97 (-) Transcript_23692:1386-1676(-)|eukprot:CAMPEP_0185569148 /NCGR_PEP_ID=MMETSP0434-20130131/1864_1 /TAXON_ID=626734 ORGANISM="Favella taraikaensis, Strain Fe Narragansett Bay" /NCGR_SAMPLE_ID=MMETSP0434 /ASSEMBLY_ACC=CAM_ASM_000379 /LENGTH=96 /DNA_ID=CAMNT_0028183847 /DNA_START=1053 /DNA_END=1343 /DNA_ORIENTATION=-
MVTDKQDKLIMLKHSQEVREIVLTISYRNLFVITAFVSADGKSISLQDRAVKYNDPLGVPVPPTGGNQYAAMQQLNMRFFEIPFRSMLQNLVQFQI